MKTIYKYSLPKTGNQTVILPARAKVLAVGSEFTDIHFNAQRIVFWALIEMNENTPIVPREFRVCATGETLPTEVTADKFIGTVQFDDGTKWHVFELNRNEDL